IGPGQRPVHRHIAGRHRRLSHRRVRRCHRSLRSRTGTGHRGRTAAWRHAGQHQLAGPFLRRGCPDGRSTDRHRRAAGSRTTAHAPHVPVCAIEGAHPPRTAHAEHHSPALQLGLLHNARVRTVPDGLSAIQLGLVFFGWGLLVAFFSVFGAPRLQRRYGTARSLYAAPLFFAAALAVISIFVNNRTVLVVAVITAGIFIGINNTLTTQAVMMVSPVERPVASAAYGFVRFLGGGLAPFAAGKLVERFNLHVPFAIGALAVVAAVIVLSTAHQMLAQADHGLDEDSHLATEHGDPTDVTGEIADEFGGAGGAIDSLEEARHHA